MNARKKTELAVTLLKRHGVVYGHDVPKRLVSFWQKGEVLAASGKCLPAGFADIPSFGDGSFRVMAAAPSWEVQGEIGGLDSGVIGPDGDWKGAASCVPLFHAEPACYFVARIDDPKCPVGWYEEESFEEDGEGYVDGVFMVAPSLESFLKALVPLDDADNESMDDETWEETWEGIPEVLQMLSETDGDEEEGKLEEGEVEVEAEDDEDLDEDEDLDVDEDDDDLDEDEELDFEEDDLDDDDVDDLEDEDEDESGKR